MYAVMPDLISLPCEILFCFVFNRACPVLDTGASRDKKEGQASFLSGYLKSSQSLTNQSLFSDATDDLRILAPLSLTSDTGSDATHGLTTEN